MDATLNSTFTNLIAAFLGKTKYKQREEPNLYVFQGFTQEFYVNLQQQIPHLTFDLSVTYPSVNQFISESKELLLNMLQLSTDHWIYYEEFCVIYQKMRELETDCHIIVIRNDLFDFSYPLEIDKAIFTHLANEDLQQKELDEFKLYSECRQEGTCTLVSFVNCHFADDIKRNDIEIAGFYEESLAPAPAISTVQEDYISRNELAAYADMLQRGKLSNRHYRVTGLTKKNYHQLNTLNILAAYYNVVFQEEKDEVRTDNKEHYLPVLKKYWGDNASFRNVVFYKNPGINDETENISQGTIVADIIEQCQRAQNDQTYSDIIITAPTGAGKSLLFQIPSIYLSERSDPPLVIVISPLVVLMTEQVQELDKRGFHAATFINSDISYEERQQRLNGIQKGVYSIVYMSPELLLSYQINNLIGNRRLGMIVVDEAHLVTSWGRDFRVDYWFLGDYLYKLRQGSYHNRICRKFPVVCLTATAVYGGQDDVIEDLSTSLKLIVEPAHLYIGYVIRNNIDFTVRNPGKLSNEEKMDLVNKTIAGFARCGEKTIVYFPFTRQVEESYRKIQVQYSEIANKVTKFYGSLDKTERSKAYDDFKYNKVMVMLATKAFGMGVDIPDIVNVYHYAPTGTLADYVQEIGRAARKLPQGHAVIDFAPTDMNSVKRLWGLSGLKQYQLQAMMKKLYGMYIVQKERHQNRARNLLFSADEFNFLFDTNNIDNTVKSGLMLLNTDLMNTYKFNVITVRPKDLLTLQYIMIPRTIEQEFLAKFGRYCTKCTDVRPRKTHAAGNNGAIITNRLGDIYEIHLDNLWKDKFTDLSFAAFKYKFFKGELFPSNNQDRIVPNIRLAIHYHDAPEEQEGFALTEKKVQRISAALRNSFNNIARARGRAEFEFTEFKAKFTESYGTSVSDNNLRILLDMFVGDRVEDNPLAPPPGEWKFIIKKTRLQKTSYTLNTNKATYIEANINRYMHNMQPNSADGRDYIDYLSIPAIGTDRNTGKGSYQQLIASLLQLFDIASYELDGGRNPQIFVRINDPLKLQSLARKATYKNNILTDINRRHDNAITLLNKFMLTTIPSEERWHIIEQYFLGKDDIVDTLLQIKRNTTSPFSPRNSETGAPATQKATECVTIVENPAFKGILSWQELSLIIGKENTSGYEQHELPFPDNIGAELYIDNHKIDTLLLWQNFDITVMEQAPSEAVRKILQQNNWLVQILGEEDFNLINEHMKG